MSKTKQLHKCRRKSKEKQKVIKYMKIFGVGETYDDGSSSWIIIKEMRNDICQINGIHGFICCLLCVNIIDQEDTYSCLPHLRKCWRRSRHKQIPGAAEINTNVLKSESHAVKNIVLFTFSSCFCSFKILKVQY